MRAALTAAVLLLAGCGLGGPSKEDVCNAAGGDYVFVRMNQSYQPRSAIGFDGKPTIAWVWVHTPEYECEMPR